MTETERTCLDDGTPYLNIGKGPETEPIAILEVTPVF